jgi:hypothetical protein
MPVFTFRPSRLISALLILLASVSLSAQPTHAQPGAAPDAELQAAVQHFITAIGDANNDIRKHPFYQGDVDQAAGVAHLTRMIVRTLEEDVILDPDYPYFRVLDFRTREGGDNADQRYLISAIRGGEKYRIWGTRGTLRRLEFQLYAGLPWLQQGGKLISTLTEEDVHYNADGTFEVILDPARHSGNWLSNPAAGTMVMVRQIFSDWAHETPGDIHIDRVGYEGKLKPALDRAELTARLERAAVNLRQITALWPDFVQRQYVDKLPANTLPPPMDPAGLGGVKGRWMSTGYFDLKDDEALILTTWPTTAKYQGIQLCDMWFASLEYANRQTSLTADQAFKSSDGAYHFVIAGRDPGIQNWLDTMGLRRGVILLRYDGMRGQSIPAAAWPRLQKVKLADLHKYLPKDTPAFTAAQRSEAISVRRKHVQRRFGV